MKRWRARRGGARRFGWFAVLCVVAATAATVSASAWAHEPSRALLSLSLDGAAIDGRIDVSLRDLEDALGVDADGDRAITWGELTRRRPDIDRYLGARLSFLAADAACGLRTTTLRVDRHGGAAYAAVGFDARCAKWGQTPESDPDFGHVTLDYGLLFDIDSAHRALVRVEAGGRVTTSVLSADRKTLVLEPASSSRSSSRWASFAAFVGEGVTHIWQGYDHLAFLALLVLPGLVGPRGRSHDWRRALRELAVIVTSFTAAHSVTLALAAAGAVPVPQRAVETIIAASVLVAALVNLWPRAPLVGARLAFGFGLVHGFGFANALAELDAGAGNLLAALCGFNLGVELGQLALVGAALPVLLALRSMSAKRGALVVHAASLACAVVAVGWVVQRL